jgi:hypothetical protein
VNGGGPAVPHEPPKAELEFIARFTVQLTGELWNLGPTSDLGTRRIIPITGGSFTGPLINGTILDNGADWQVVTADGTTVVDTRYLLQADDDALIFLQTRGFRHGPPEVLAALAAGDDVDPTEYTFRIHLHFETSSVTYGWLNKAVAVGSAIRLPTAVVYDAYIVR